MGRRDGLAWYSKIPCRIASDVSDEQALVLLHTANFFTRSLTVTERAAATKALGIQVEQMRANDPTLTGMRTEDVKARIVEEMTGRKVSGKTIKREEEMCIRDRACPSSCREDFAPTVLEQ